MGDPKLVEEVLGEDVAAGVRRSASNFCAWYVVLGGLSSLAVAHERARQAALGHRALRLLDATWNQMPTVAQQDEMLAIIRELRGELEAEAKRASTEGAKAERVKVVAWLDHEVQMRAEHACTNLLSCPGCAEVRTLNDARVRLERGEHDDG